MDDGVCVGWEELVSGWWMDGWSLVFVFCVMWGDFVVGGWIDRLRVLQDGVMGRARSPHHAQNTTLPPFPAAAPKSQKNPTQHKLSHKKTQTKPNQNAPERRQHVKVKGHRLALRLPLAPLPLLLLVVAPPPPPPEGPMLLVRLPVCCCCWCCRPLPAAEAERFPFNVAVVGVGPGGEGQQQQQHGKG